MQNIRIVLTLVLFIMATTVGGCSTGTQPQLAQGPQEPSADNPKPRLLVLMVTDNSDHQYPGGQEGSIAPGVVENEAMMSRFFQRVAVGADMSVSVQKIEGRADATDEFNCRNVNQAVRNLSINPDDVVMFYYAGHGFNIGIDSPSLTKTTVRRAAPLEFQNSPATKFPFIACNTSLTDTPNLDMIATWLLTKKPRLAIVMADACNSFLPGTGPEPETFFGTAAPAAGPEPRLRSLFRDATGTVLVAGSDWGRYSYYYVAPGRQMGGVATLEFLRVLGDNGLPRTQPTTWSQVGGALQGVRVPVRDRRNGRMNTDMQRPWISTAGPFATAMGVQVSVGEVLGVVEVAEATQFAQQVGGGTPVGRAPGPIPTLQHRQEMLASPQIEVLRPRDQVEQVGGGTPVGPVLGPRPGPKPPTQTVRPGESTNPEFGGLQER